jgi:uncharacterized protein
VPIPFGQPIDHPGDRIRKAVRPRGPSRKNLMETSPIRVHLDDLALRSGENWERTFPLEIPPVVLGGTPYEVRVPDGVTMWAERVAGGFLVRVTLSAMVYGPCARCLDEVRLAVRADEEEFVPTAKGGWEESDFSEFIQDLVVDVKGLAREALVLALPAQMVCSTECRGLCPYCGKDLNLGACNCGPAETDERWGRLKDLRLDE